MGKRILIVDDEADYIACISMVLKKAGYALEIARNGREAIGAYVRSIQRDEPMSLILLDIKLPDVNGIEVLDIIRKEEEKWGIKGGLGVPIVAMTAYDKPWMEPELMKGCDDYFVKSIEDDELLRKIESKLKEKGGI